MSEMSDAGGMPAQLPKGDAIYLDHVGHFVASVDEAAIALARAGFAPTPVSVQVNPDPAGGPPRPTGTGNVCAMLRNGYLEVLFKTADTPLGAEFDAARHRYGGLHLVAFAIADATASHRRLEAVGFSMQPLVHMQRPVDTVTGPDTAAFEVVRIVPGTMPEGRVQVLRHLTEHTVWQPRWLDHPNTARALCGLSIVVGDLQEATDRFVRFTGRPARSDEEGTAIIALDRGRLELLDARAWRRRWPQIEIPALPFMGQCDIEVSSLGEARGRLEAGELDFETVGNGLVVRFPPALGDGVWVFSPAGG